MKGKGPMGGCGPYGKGKGKGKGPPKPKEEKPLVNANQINPSKEPFDGGISFKNILQEKISKHIMRPIAPGDLTYACEKAPGGRKCTLTITVLGPEHVYEADQLGKDDKQAGQIAASKALEAIFPDVCIMVMEAHASGQGVIPAAQEGGAATTVDPQGEPKGLLNRYIQIAIGRPVATGDVVYETKWQGTGYVCTVSLNAMDAGAGLHVYTSDLPNCRDQKQAEKDAARKALEANAEEFETLSALHVSKPKRANPKQSGKANGKKGYSNEFFAPVSSAPKVVGLQ